MKRFALIVIFFVLAAHSARAANCEKSREYLLGNLVGDLTLPPHTYDDLFKTCMATIGMSNVKDAYILKDGGIGVVAKQNSIAATAATLSQFRRLPAGHAALPDAQGIASDQVHRQRRQDIVDVIDNLSENQGHLLNSKPRDRDIATP